METIEIWKDIPNYEGMYQVSSIGRIRSLDRIVHINKQQYRTFKGRIIRFSKCRSGYFHVQICKNGIINTRNVHSLVAEAFLNHIPKGRAMVVNHKDFNRTNNKLENLEIVTARENSNRKHLKSTSIYTGVSRKRNKWGADISINGKTKYLGLFETEIEAHNRYLKELETLK